MYVLAVGNQKGGVAKTSTAAALGVIFSREGQPVHIIDMDPQADLTTAFGQADPEGELHQALKSRGPLPMVRLSETLTITPSSIDLARGESEFLGEPGREYMLKTALEKTELPKKTLVIIDCPPSLGVLTTNSFTVASSVLVPLKPGGFELRALVNLAEVVQVLKERVNHQLEIIGTVLTECQSRRAITRQVEEEVGQFYPVLGRVRSDANLVYATTGGGILEWKRSNAFSDYEALVGELKERVSWFKSK